MHEITTPSLVIAGSTERFPVHRVYCVGRNYAEHAREFGNDPDREPPFFFAKPADAAFVVDEGYEGIDPGAVPYPSATEDLHHEIELVVALGREGRNVASDSALDLVWGYGVGVDLTRRDLQNVAKELRRPWDLAKGFDASAPMSALVPVEICGHPASGAIHAEINGEVRQNGDLADQIWGVPEIIAFLSESVELRPGDLIMTGTPAGVGPLRAGDEFTGAIEGIGTLHFVVGSPR